MGGSSTGRAVTRASVAAMLASGVALWGPGPARGAATPQLFAAPDGGAGLTSIIAGPNGNLWFGESEVGGDGQYHVGEITPGGQVAGDFPVPVDPSDSDPGEGPENLVDSNGDVWFTSDVGSSIYAMAPSGAATQEVHDLGFGAIGLAPDDGGGVWLFATSNSNHSIQRYDPGASATTPYGTEDLNQVFAPLATAPDGTSVWYPENLTGGDVLVDQPDGGAPAASVTLPTVSSTYQVNSLAFDSSGDLWFTEHAPFDLTFPVGGAIGEIPAGSQQARIVWSQDVTQNTAPGSMTAGPGGTMYFADSGGISEVTGGTVTFGSLGLTPQSVTLGPDGNLWFTVPATNQIGQIAPSALFTAPPAPTPSPAPAPTPGPTPTGPGVKARAPNLTLTLARQTLAAVRSHGALKARCRLLGPGTCTATATTAAKTARALKLDVARAARTFTLGHAHKVFARAGTGTLSIPLSARVRRAIGHARRLTVTVTAVSSAPNVTSQSASHRITLTAAAPQHGAAEPEQKKRKQR